MTPPLVNVNGIPSLCVGFTGTQAGLNARAKALVFEELVRLRDKEHHRVFRHGDCIGADSDAHDIAVALGFHIIVHPPIVNTKRAYKKGDEAWTPRQYIHRNRDIVRQCHTLIACPKNVGEEVLRSGTWSTVRFARTHGRTVFLFSAQRSS